MSRDVPSIGVSIAPDGRWLLVLAHLDGLAAGHARAQEHHVEIASAQAGNEGRGIGFLQS